MPVADTSIQAYEELGHKEPIQIEKILAVMQHGKNYTNRELERMTGITISSVTARVNKLYKKGRVVLNCRRQCMITSKNVKAWSRWW